MEGAKGAVRSTPPQSWPRIAAEVQSYIDRRSGLGLAVPALDELRALLEAGGQLLARAPGAQDQWSNARADALPIYEGFGPLDEPGLAFLLEQLLDAGEDMAARLPLFPRSTWVDHTEASPELRMQVLTAAQRGDQSAIDYAWHLYGGLVHSWARKRSLGEEEMPSLYENGFAKALAKFEPERGTRFSTYLHWWLRHAYNRLLHRDNLFGGMRGRAAGRVYRAYLAIKKGTSDLTSEDVETIAQQAETSVETTLAVLQCVRPTLGLQIHFEGEVMERPLPDQQEPDEFEPGDQARFWEQVDAVLRDRRLSRVVRARFVERRTLAEIGRELGVTKERVRQLERKAITRLRPRMGVWSGDRTTHTEVG